MDVTLHIPDELAQRLKAAGGDLSRRALEALALEEYKLHHLTVGELCRLLGLGTQEDLDAFLAAHGVRAGDTGRDTDRARASGPGGRAGYPTDEPGRPARRA